MWDGLCSAGGPLGVKPELLRALGIYNGEQGIWVDKEHTQGLTPQGPGVTVGLLHTGSSYPDDLSSDGVFYHYPATNRPPGRDQAEVDATKAAKQLNLPVFVITHTTSREKSRDVHLGWIEDWDDRARAFLVAFGEDPPLKETPQPGEGTPFQL
jgi:hypothetical protein